MTWISDLHTKSSTWSQTTFFEEINPYLIRPEGLRGWISKNTCNTLDWYCSVHSKSRLHSRGKSCKKSFTKPEKSLESSKYPRPGRLISLVSKFLISNESFSIYLLILQGLPMTRKGGRFQLRQMKRPISSTNFGFSEIHPHVAFPYTMSDLNAFWILDIFWAWTQTGLSKRASKILGGVI